MFWILPVALILLVILRVFYPNARKAFLSGLSLLAFAMILQFQNCGTSTPTVNLDEDTHEREYVDCTKEDSKNDPNCNPADDACVIDPNSNACLFGSESKTALARCIQTGAKMPSSDKRSIAYVSPCDEKSGVTYCPKTQTALRPQDCK